MYTQARQQMTHSLYLCRCHKVIPLFPTSSIWLPWRNPLSTSSIWLPWSNPFSTSTTWLPCSNPLPLCHRNLQNMFIQLARTLPRDDHVIMTYFYFLVRVLSSQTIDDSFYVFICLPWSNPPTSLILLPWSNPLMSSLFLVTCCHLPLTQQ